MPVLEAKSRIHLPEGKFLLTTDGTTLENSLCWLSHHIVYRPHQHNPLPERDPNHAPYPYPLQFAQFSSMVDNTVIIALCCPLGASPHPHGLRACPMKAMSTSLRPCVFSLTDPSYFPFPCPDSTNTYKHSPCSSCLASVLFTTPSQIYIHITGSALQSHPSRTRSGLLLPIN